jgi:putative transposase
MFYFDQRYNMKVHKAYRYRIYPTYKQQEQFKHHFGCARWIYNYFLERKTKQYKESKKSDSFLQMNKHLTELKKQEKYQWLNNVSRQSLGNSLANLDTAFSNFYNKRAEYPKFKNKYSKQTFKIGSPICSIRGEFIHLPQIGNIRCDFYNLPKEYKLFSITISKTPTNKYFASINIEQEIPDSKIDPTKPEIGIDFGLKTFITCSNGVKIEHPLPLRKLLRKLKRFSRRVSRRKLGSKRREVARRKLALLHERISNHRLDFLHKLSRKMVSENQAIYLEDLNLKGMMSRFGRGVCDSGWYEHSRQLDYKGQWYGCYVGRIDRFFASSKLCNKCKCINQALTLSDREWDCSCGAHHDRDVNAGLNILEYGRADRNLRTGRVEVVDSLVELSKQGVS